MRGQTFRGKMFWAHVGLRMCTVRSLTILLLDRIEPVELNLPVVNVQQRDQALKKNGAIAAKAAHIIYLQNLSSIHRDLLEG